MRAKDAEKIIIKGSDWLFDRLDSLNYPPSLKLDMMRRIWRYDATVPTSFIKRVLDDAKTEIRENPF